MRAADILSQYRTSINPPYKRKDLLSILGTLLILLALPLTVFVAVKVRPWGPRAAGTAAAPANTASVIEPGSMVSGASYIVFADGSNYYVRNGRTGEIQFSGTDAGQVINSAINALPSGAGSIQLTEGTFNVGSTINLKSYVTLEGQGAGVTRLSAVGGITTAVVKIPATTGGNWTAWVNLRSLQIAANSIPGVSCIYVEGNISERAESVTLEHLDLRDSIAYGIKIDMLFRSHFDDIYIFNVANGIFWDDVSSGTGGNSRLDHIFVQLGQNNGVGLEFKGCEHLSMDRIQVSPTGVQTGLVGLKFTSVHLANASQIDLEGMFTGIIIDGANTGFEASQDVTIDTGYVHSGSPSGKGIFVKQNALRSNLLRLVIDGLGSGGAKASIGIDDDVIAVEGGSRYRDCHVKNFNTLVDRVANNSSTFSNTAGYSTENSGTATIPNGSSSLTFVHSLAATPSVVVVTPQGNPGSGGVWVSAKDGANITVSRSGTSGDLPFYWRAEVK